MIKLAYSVSFLLSINIFVWQNDLYFPKELRKYFRNIAGIFQLPDDDLLRSKHVVVFSCVFMCFNIEIGTSRLIYC